MKKLFTLIHGDDIRLDSGVKILKGKDYSEILDSKGVLDKALDDANKYKEGVVTEIEKSKAQAEAEGFQKGLNKWNEQIAYLEAEIKTVHAEIQKIIVPLALSGAKKIFGKELELAPEAIVDIVSNNVKSISEHRKVTIYVNKKDREYLDAAKERLESKFSKLESLSIQERDDIESGGCIIETEIGIINAQTANQWSALEQAFETVLKENGNV
jgi:type III secretion protein L